MPPRRKRSSIRLRASRIQGRGVFATRRIRKGTRIVEYTGERLTTEEVDRRYARLPKKRDRTFLFEVDESTCIDAARRGSVARYVNHSCAPNCEVVIEDGRIFIEAIANIAPGTELTYDYSLEPPDVPRRVWARLYRCSCGADRCRGVMVDKRLLRAKRGKRSRKS